MDSQRIEDEPIRLMSRELEEELWKHGGKWALVTYDTLVAVAASPSEVYQKARYLGRSDLSLLLLHYCRRPGVMYYL